MKIDELRKEIAYLATRAVMQGEGSHSCHENLATGPRYQQIEVADGYNSFRNGSRDKFIREIPNANARCLDIGSNMGVTTRYIASLGAREAVGIEYDPYFIAIANLVNAAKGVENARFYQRDATRPDEYARLGNFQITYSLSSFNYARHALSAINNITDRMFVVETHRALPGCYKLHHELISPYFPYSKVLGFTDHGRGSKDHRLFIAFSREKHLLTNLPSYDDGWKTVFFDLDLEKTQFSYLKAYYSQKSGKNDYKKGIQGAHYWKMLAKGFDDWLVGVSWNENAYYRYLCDIKAKDIPGGEILDTRADHSVIINRRMKTFELANSGQLPSHPVIVKVKRGSRGSGTHWFRDNGNYKIAEADGVSPSFDGIHRCFMYKYCGWTYIPAKVIFVP